MVPRHTVVPVGPKENPQSSSGPIRHKQNFETPSVHISQCGPQGSSHRLPLSRLEPVADNLSLSRHQSPDENSSQAPDLQRDSSPHCSNMAQEQLVPPAPGASAQSYSDSQPHPLPGGASQDCLRFIKDNETAGFMDFLIYAAKRHDNVDAANVIFSESDKSQSTIPLGVGAFTW